MLHFPIKQKAVYHQFCMIMGCRKEPNAEPTYPIPFWLTACHVPMYVFLCSAYQSVMVKCMELLTKHSWIFTVPVTFQRLKVASTLDLYSPLKHFYFIFYT